MFKALTALFRVLDLLPVVFLAEGTGNWTDGTETGTRGYADHLEKVTYTFQVMEHVIRRSVRLAPVRCVGSADGYTPRNHAQAQLHRRSSPRRRTPRSHSSLQQKRSAVGSTRQLALVFLGKLCDPILTTVSSPVSFMIPARTGVSLFKGGSEGHTSRECSFVATTAPSAKHLRYLTSATMYMNHATLRWSTPETSSWRK